MTELHSQVAHQINERIQQNTNLEEQAKTELAAAVNEVARSLPNAITSDSMIYRIVVLSLGITMLAVVIGAIVLTALNKTAPDVLTALGSAAIGALAGLLAPSIVNTTRANGL